MPVRVADIEADAPLPEMCLSPGETSLLALVRWRGCPAGLVRLPAGDGCISPRRLLSAIQAQVPLPPALQAPPPGSASLSASIIVCTRRRPELLRVCLDALLPQARLGREVIVVDNDPAGTETQSLVAGYPYRCLVEPLPGLNRARNRGLHAASHPIVAFTDDDCLPDPGWVDALLAPYAVEAAGTGAVAVPGAVTGLVLPYELLTPAQERYEAYCANRRIFRTRVFRPADTPPSTAGAAGMGANISFRRDLLLDLGGFDPRFDGGTLTLSGGDTDMFARLLSAGHTIVYRPDALVWHRHPRQEAALRRVIFGYGVGLQAFLAKRLLEDRDPQALVTALRWLAAPPLKAAWNGLRGRPYTPMDLLWLEFWGGLHGPSRFLAARRFAAQGDASPQPSGLQNVKESDGRPRA